MVEEELVEAREQVCVGINLAAFRDATLFQSSVITFLVRLKSDKEEMSRLRRVFTKVDTNHDGFLQPEEITQAMDQFSSESQLGEDLNWKKIIKKCDTDQDGKISFEEFLTAASDRRKILNKQYLKEAFDVMDIDGDGRIEAFEVKACFAKGKMGDFQAQGVGLEDAFYDKIIKSIDINNDGFVTFEEFEIHMMKMVEKMNLKELRQTEPKPKVTLL